MPVLEVCPFRRGTLGRTSRVCQGFGRAECSCRVFPRACLVQENVAHTILVSDRQAGSVPCPGPRCIGQSGSRKGHASFRSPQLMPVPFPSTHREQVSRNRPLIPRSGTGQAYWAGDSAILRSFRPFRPGRLLRSKMRAGFLRDIRCLQ